MLKREFGMEFTSMGSRTPPKPIQVPPVSEDKMRAAAEKLVRQIQALDQELRLPSKIRKELVGNASLACIVWILEPMRDDLARERDELITGIMYRIETWASPTRARLRAAVKKSKKSGLYDGVLALRAALRDPNNE